jgi:hypothetical protein
MWRYIELTAVRLERQFPRQRRPAAKQPTGFALVYLAVESRLRMRSRALPTMASTAVAVSPS